MSDVEALIELIEELRFAPVGRGLANQAADALVALKEEVRQAEVVCDSYAAENQRISDERDRLREALEKMPALVRESAHAEVPTYEEVEVADRVAVAVTRAARAALKEGEPQPQQENQNGS